MAIIKPEIKSQILKFPSFPEFETWEETFDKIYEDLNDDELYVGWNDYCSEKVKPIPTVQMDEWLKHTLDSIKNLKPEIVLEIGVGSGVILEKIAPLCDRYVGTDISSKSVQFLNEFVQRKKWCDTVSVKKREASVFAPEEKEYYDTIILNSVIQYFSNVDHLMSVMEGVLAATKPGGRIFIGDVRNRALARNRQADIEAATLHVECPVSAFQENIKYGVDGDKEICINPEFFKLFAQNHPDKVDHVVIQSRRAKYHNEMSRYRYDAIIYLKNPEAPYEKKEAHGVNWSVISTPDIEKMLATSDYGHYLVKEIPNARISRSLLALNMNLNKPKTIFQEEFKKVKKEFKDTATDPEDLVLLGERFGYKSRIVPSTKDVNCFDILYFRKEGIHSHYFEDEPLEGQPVYEDFINNPVENLNMQQIYGEFIIHLNRFIEEHYIQMPHINFVKDLTSREIVF